MIAAGPGSESRLARVTRGFWMGLVLGALGLVIVLAFVLLVFGDPTRGDLVGRITAMAAIIPVMSVFGLLAATAMARGGLTGVMFAAMILVALATIGWLLLFWDATGSQTLDSALPVKICGSLTIVGGGLSVYGYLIGSPRRRMPLIVVRTLFLVAMTAASIAALFMMWSAWWQRHLEVLFVTILVSTVVALLDGLAYLVLVRMETAAAKRVGESVSRRLSLELACPKCGHEQELPVGVSTCANCGAGVVIEVEEPRCECGYLLYRLVGDSCPECGREVPEEQRWGWGGVREGEGR